jgi:hypothetical protein
MLRRAALFVLLAVPGFAQKDFLTPDEVDQLREAQEVPDRLNLYMRFATQRMDMLEQSFAQQKTGRSVLIHDLLEQYTGIIDAIDTVVDDAIRRGKSLEAIPKVADTQKTMLARLEKWLEAKPRDLNRFQFVLEQAIESTRDSIEMNSQDIKERKRDVLDKDAKEKKDREALTTPEQTEAKKAEDQKKATEEAKPQKKAPTLRRTNEPPPPEKKQ